MSKALGQLKPLTPEQQVVKTRGEADFRVKNILAAVKNKTSLFVETLTAGTIQQPEYAFRNKGELTESDLEILESGKTEMNGATSDPPKEDSDG